MEKSLYALLFHVGSKTLEKKSCLKIFLISRSAKGQENFIGMVVMFCILIGVVVTQVYTLVKSPNLYLRCVHFIEDACCCFIAKKKRVRKEGTKEKQRKKFSHFFKLKLC